MRAPNRPIARITGSGYGLEVAAARAEWHIEYAGPQSIFVDDDGRVFCVPQGCWLMLHWCESQPQSAWWVGNFSVQRGQHLRAAILEELRDRCRELRTQAA